MSRARLSEFDWNPLTRVWELPASRGRATRFEYSDGPGEEAHLMAAVTAASDLSDNASDLTAAVDSWLMHYYLAPGRANAIRALGLPGSIRVLELGSGCGAISRYLGEHYREVTCLEGSPTRAAIGSARCRGLSNVKVFCADLSDLEFDAEYDLVILNGVLEYAPAFFRGRDAEDPAQSLVRLARSAARPSGLVMIGIENQIGLKYWCGAPEDHTPQAYEGIHGYPSGDRVRTFSRRQLSRMLAASGFTQSGWFSCFPDYKFTSTVLSDKAADPARELFLHNWVEYPADNRWVRRAHTIHEGLAARTLSGAGLLHEFANSFLVVAGGDESVARFDCVFRPQWVAKRISTRDRDKLHHRITTLHDAPDGLSVTKEPVGYDDAAGRGRSAGPAVTVPWVPGELMLVELSRAVVGRRTDQMSALLAEYHSELIRRFATNRTDIEGYPLLDESCVDFLMRNIIRSPGGLVPIDLEWHAPEPVAADYMLFRSVWNDLIGVNHAWASAQIPDFDAFIISAVRKFYPAYGRRRHAANRDAEQRFLSAAGRRPAGGKGWSFWTDLKTSVKSGFQFVTGRTHF